MFSYSIFVIGAVINYVAQLGGEGGGGSVGGSVTTLGHKVKGIDLSQRGEGSKIPQNCPRNLCITLMVFKKLRDNGPFSTHLISSTTSHYHD